MANFLDYECPKCTGTDEIEVVASIWVRLAEDGTDSDSPDAGYEFEPTSAAICQGCGFEGKFYEFEPPADPIPSLIETLQKALVALNTAPRFAVPALDTNSYAIAALCEAAIRETGVWGATERKTYVSAGA